MYLWFKYCIMSSERNLYTNKLSQLNVFGLETECIVLRN